MRGETSTRAEVEPDGDFSFDAGRPGSYRLRVETLGGAVLHQQFLTIMGDDGALVIRLPRIQRDRPPSGTISVRQLKRKVPRKASKELEKAVKASHRGDLQKAILHLNKALEADPDFMEARNNLGACYLRLHRQQQALAEFEQAHQLDPDSELVNTNLASVLLSAGRYPEAEQAARRGLHSDPTSDRARLVLALSLQAQNRAPGVAPQFPRARLAAAEILARQGFRRQAARQLKLYLDGALAAADRLAVESWLAKLRP